MNSTDKAMVIVLVGVLAFILGVLYISGNFKQDCLRTMQNHNAM